MKKFLSALFSTIFAVSMAHADCVQIDNKQYCEVATAPASTPAPVVSPPVATCTSQLIWNGAQWVCATSPVYVYQQPVNPVVGIAVGAAALYLIGHGFNGGHGGYHHRR